MHFVHCFLPVAEGWAGEPRSASSRRVSSSSELDLPPGDPCEAGLLQLDMPLLRAQLRGSRLLDAMRMFRQGRHLNPWCSSHTSPALPIPQMGPRGSQDWP
jgi:myosin-18